MFFEPYMPELQYCRDAEQIVREGKHRSAMSGVQRTTQGGMPYDALPTASHKRRKPAALAYGLIVALAVAGIAAGFYHTVASGRR